VPNLPSLKAKKPSKLPREKVLLELGRRLANSIPPLSETLEKPVYLVSRGKIREAETGGSYYWNKR